MRRTHRRPPVVWIVAVVFAFVTGVVITWILTSSGHGWLQGAGSAGAGEPDTSFAIAGDLEEPVAPGLLVPIDVVLTNSHPDALRVTALAVTVTGVYAPHATATLPCSVQDFVVDQVNEGFAVQVSGNESRSLSELGVPREEWPRVGMVDADENQDGCKNATLELGYTATGRLRT
jgi:hypothetical protein